MSPRRSFVLAFLVLALASATAHADLGAQVTAALAKGSGLAYALVFVGGVLTSLTPCVYPMIPITLGIFGARGKSVSRARGAALAATYVAGIGVMYASLGVVSALAGRAFGTFMSSPYVMAPIAIVFVIMAASMFGAFELQLPASLQQRLSGVSGTGWGRAFSMGLVGGVIAAPCTGPVLASVLAFVATTRSVFFGGSLLFVYALGMGTLFFVLAATAATLPRSGAWMEAVKSVFGIVMLLAALYFLRNIVPALSRYGDGRTVFAVINVALIVVGIGIGAVHLSFHDGIAARVRKGFGIAMVTAGGFGAIAWMLAPRVDHSPAPTLAWVEGEPAAIAAAHAQAKPLLLDFAASWCIPCKELELKTFADQAVRRALFGHVVTGKVDCSADDDAVAAVKARYGADTLPTVVLLDANGKVAAKWNRIVEPAELIDAVTKLTN